MAYDQSESKMKAKGDLVVARGQFDPQRLPVGPDTQVLTADSTTDLGVKWAAGGGGSGDALTAATPFTTEIMIDPVTGGDMTVLVFPEDIPVLAVKLAGDTFPRWLLTADSKDGLFVTDGTYDIYDGPGLALAQGSDRHFIVTKGVGATAAFEVNGDLIFGSNSGGVVIKSPNLTRYRIVVDNAGTLSTEIVM